MGLVARSYWIDHDQALAANPADGIPLASALVLQHGAGRKEVRLAPALAAEENLGALRVLWIRKPGDTSAMAGAMARTAESIRRLIPQRGLEPVFSEVLVPETIEDLRIPVPPPEWQQFVVEPVDRRSPSTSDSFWEKDTMPPRQGLHAALIIGGVLGGSNHEPSAPRDAQGYRPWIVHPFTRAVRGADRVRRETRAILRERLGTISAADVRPSEFYKPDAPEDADYVRDAVNWVRDLDGAALRFHRPEIALARRGQTFLEFLLEVVHFLGWALKAMFGLQRWRDVILAIRAQIARKLESDDYGATIDAGAPDPRGLDLEDWDAREAEARAAGEPRITEASRADGRLPDRSLWRGLVDLVPSLIDGSASPSGWTPRTRFDHMYALPPQDVVRTEGALLDAAASSGGTPASDELRGVKRIGEYELTEARRLAAIGLEQELVTFSSPTGRVVLSAGAIADQARRAADKQRERFADELSNGGGPVDARSLPFLGQLRASVVGDLIIARLAAELVSSLPATSVPSGLASIKKMVQTGTLLVLGTVVIGVGIAALLVRFSQEIDALLAAMQVAYPTSWAQLLWWIVGATCVMLIFIFSRLFSAFHSYNEVGLRRLEYVERRTDAAVAAWKERNRLRDSERILAAWEDILSSVGVRDQQPQPPLADVPSNLPEALQVAEPDIDDDDLTRLIVEDVIEPEWFGKAFRKLLTESLDKDEQDALWDDEGLPGGPVARLRVEALDGAIQRRHWEDWGARVVAKVVAKIADDNQIVHPLVKRRTDRLAAKQFRAEITAPLSPEYRPGWDYEHAVGDDSEQLFDPTDVGRRSTARARQGVEEFVLTAPMAAVDTVLVYRRFGRVAAPDDDKVGEDLDSGTGRA